MKFWTDVELRTIADAIGHSLTGEDVLALHVFHVETVADAIALLVED